jgi:hypothetical protein
LPSGQWAAKDPDAWAEWAQINGWSGTSVADHQTEAPKGFDAVEMALAQEIKPQKPLPPELREAPKPKPKVNLTPFFIYKSSRQLTALARFNRGKRWEDWLGQDTS